MEAINTPTKSNKMPAAKKTAPAPSSSACLLYTSDAADE